MNLSYRWLDELVGLGGKTPAEIQHELTFHVAAVDAVQEVGTGLEGVVTGRVTLKYIINRSIVPEYMAELGYAVQQTAAEITRALGGTRPVRPTADATP